MYKNRLVELGKMHIIFISCLYVLGDDSNQTSMCLDPHLHKG